MTSGMDVRGAFTLLQGAFSPDQAEAVKQAASTKVLAPAARPEPIAIIGLAGRFPGAADIDAFWQNLLEGKDSIGEIPRDRWPLDGFYDPQPGRPDRSISKWGGFVDEAAAFDPAFFNLSAREADHMDPQQRLFLMETWRALEDAGHAGPTLDSQTVGVFVGCAEGDYADLLRDAGRLHNSYAFMGNASAILSARIAYHLDLHGPALAVDTACSSALVALHLACESLRRGECSMAIAGASYIMATPRLYLLGSSAGMLSPTGRCRAFGAGADGFVPAEAVGAVVLKPLSAAIEDGDHIRAIVEGSGMNQDGRTNGITAPNAPAQAALQRSVYQRAGIDPASIGYVETHGTGTKLGDPIEIEALTESFRHFTPRAGFCRLGSVKSNIGHAQLAAGMAGLAKLVLALEHGQIPPSLHADEPNAHLSLAGSPFRIATVAEDWPHHRRGAISAFGFSGTNAHAVLSAAGPLPARASQRPNAYIFAISGRNETDLARRRAALRRWIGENPGADPLDLSFTLMMGRAHFAMRDAVVAGGLGELASHLEREVPGRQTEDLTRQASQVVSLLPEALAGVGAGYRRALDFLARAYRSGAVVDAEWRRIWLDMRPRRIRLPLTEFDTSHHWIAPERPETIVFAAADALPEEHRIGGEAIVPGAGLLVAMLARGGLGALERVSLERPVTRGEPGEIALTLRREGDALRLSDSAGRLVVQAQAAPAGAALTLDASAHGPDAATVATRLYQRFEQAGFAYGPSLRGIRAATVNGTGARATIDMAGTPRFGAELSAEALDCAFQCAALFATPGDVLPHLVPRGVEHFTLHAPVPQRFDVIAKARDVSSGAITVDLTAMAPDGTPLFSVEGLAFAARATAAHGLLALTQQWRDVAIRPAKGSTGWQRLRIAPPRAGETRREATARTLDTAREWLAGTMSALERGSSVRLAVLHAAGDAHAAALSGFWRCVAREFPQLALVVLADDRGGDTEAAIASLMPQAGVVEARLIAGMAQKLVLEETALPAARPRSRDGVHVVTGGTGGLGRMIAAHLAASGAGTVVLVSRSARGGHEELVGATRLVEIAADVADRPAMKAALDRARTFGPLQGVVHAAGVAPDAGAAATDAALVEAALGPKVDGLINLIDLTADDSEVEIVLFGALLGWSGNAGQAAYAYANRLMGALAEGDPRVVTVDWPLWKDGGMAIPPTLAARLEQNHGLVAMPQATGLSALDAVLAAGHRHVVLAHGQVDRLRRSLLVEPESAAVPDTVARAVDLVARTEAALLEAAARALKIDGVDLDAASDLADFGFDSIAVTGLCDDVNRALGIALNPALFFEKKSLAALALHAVETWPDELARMFLAARPGFVATDGANDGQGAQRRVDPEPRHDEERLPMPVAIVGLDLRFPGAPNPDTFWHNLRDGVDAITEVPAARWDWRVTPDGTGRWGGFIDDIDRFDAAFFGIAPAEADLMDPQQRMLLQSVWRAIEDAGHGPRTIAGSATGVFVGCAGYDYATVLRNAGASIEAMTPTGIAPSLLANRISFQFDFNGPSETVDTACSSGLVALDRAIKALRSGACEAAIVGASSAMLAPDLHVAFSKAGMLSPGGRCRSFDASADGYVRGEGVAALYLKPLDRALQDGDDVLAVLRGSAVNHGGRATSLTAPNAAAQARVVASAWSDAGVTLADIGYIEAHGTGTSLGDPVEMRGLALAADDGGVEGRCVVGSVKSQIGHLEAVAGLAGLIAAVFAVREGRAPANPHLAVANPHITLGETFVLAGRETGWPKPGLRRVAGVSSFGFGGTNAHVVVENHLPMPLAVADSERSRIICLSARTGHDLDARIVDLARWLELRCAPSQVSADLIAGLRTALAGIAGADIAEIGPADSFAALGLDEPGLRRLADATEDLIGVRPPAGSISIDGTLKGLAAALGLAEAPSSLAQGLEPTLDDVADTLLARDAMAERLAFVAPDIRTVVSTLRALAEGRTPPVAVHRGRASKTPLQDGGSDLEVQARRWVAGSTVTGGQPRRRLRLPAYRFQGERHWVRTAALPGARTTLLDAIWQPVGALPGGDIVRLAIPVDAAGVTGLVTGLHEIVLARLAAGNTAAMLVEIAGEAALAAACAEAAAGLLATWSAEDPRLSANVVLRGKGPDPQAPAGTAANAASVGCALYRHGSGRIERRVLQARSQAAPVPTLPRGLACLIVGGSGALGVWLAEHLRNERGASVLRAGRRQEASPDYVSADLATRAGADAAVTETRARFGRIDAVFHLAGVLEDDFADKLTPERIARVFEAKVGVLLEIDAALARAGLAPGFRIAFSSLSGWLANPGQAAYAAANRFLDGYALAGTGWRSIAWPLWRDGGMRLDPATLDGLARDGGLELLGADDARAALGMALGGAPFAAVVQGAAEAPAIARLLGVPQDRAPEIGGDRRAVAAWLLCEALGIAEAPPPETTLVEAGLNSLTAVRLVQALRQRLGIAMAATDLIRHPTIGGLLDALAGSSFEATPQVVPALELVADSGETVDGQRLLWRQYRLDPDGFAYTMPVALAVPDHVDAGTLAAAIERLAALHPALRQRFEGEGESLRRLPAPPVTLAHAIAPEVGQQAWLRDLARLPFRLAETAPARFTMVDGMDEGPLLLAVFHHIAFDGLSLRRLLDDLEALLAGTEPAPTGESFAAFAAAQNAWLETVDAASDRSFWQAALKQPIRPLDLPTISRPGPRTRFDGETRTAIVPASTRRGLAGLRNSTGGTLFELVLTAWVATLARYGQAEIRLLVPTAGRGDRFDGTVGHLVNPVVIAADIAGDPSLDALRTRVAESARTAFAHGRWPFARALADSGHALEEIIHAGFYYQDWTGGASGLLRRLPLVFHEGELPLALEVVDEDGALELRLKHDPALIDTATADLLVNRFARLLDQLAQGDDPHLDALAAADPVEANAIVAWNAAAVRDRPFVPISESISAQARRQPARAAVMAGAETVSYGALDADADAIAAALQSAGVGAGDIVAVDLPRIGRLPAAFLGVMRAGAAYLPLDPALPVERRAYMLEDSGARLRLVTGQGGAAGTLGLGEIMPGASPEPVRLAADMPAYLLYTSGSTGAPKGVIVNHGNLANFIAAMAEPGGPGFEQDDRILALTPWSFDISGLELYLPLSRGGSLVMVGDGEGQDATLVRRYLERGDVTVAQATPATWRMALAAGWRGGGSLKRLLVGGEALPPDLADTLAGLAPDVWNMYGPTETTIWSTAGRVRSGGRVHAGHPIANTDIRIEKAMGGLCGIGVAGEIVIGGAGVSPGYHGRPDLTADRFVLLDGGRHYRTGDLGRWLADGSIEILGRIDSQLKLRGHRIEPGEIESAIIQRLGDRDCAVVMRDRAGGLAELAAFIVPGGDDPDDASRDRWLADWLPPQMLPERWVRLDALPRTANGKIDRRRLAHMPLETSSVADEPTAAGAVIDVLTTVVAAVLNRPAEKIDPAMPIRRLGVDSLRVVDIAARATEALGRRLSPTDFFNQPTLNDLARALEAERPSADRPVAAPAIRAVSPQEVPAGAVAVIGMAGRFPDAPDIDTFWANLLAGRVSVREVPPGRWDEAELAPDVPTRAALLDDIYGFDPKTFGMTAHEAACTDPQQRLVLMEARRALGDAGYEMAEMAGSRCGVFLGAAFGDYHRLMERAGEVNTFSMLGGSPSLIPARIAYHLDLKGPAIAIDTACSSSLVAVHQACRALRDGDAEMALAGGVFVMTTPLAQTLSHRTGILAPDGHCRPFDAAAGGIAIGEAVGILLLKPLERALADGDRIRGVIRATGVNQDGRTSGISAPAAPAQAALIGDVLKAAALDAADIGAIEAHGTGTRLGDPIELDALRQVFGGPRVKPAWLGSAKANIGHCYQAAGIAGLIKAMLVIERGLVPPQPALGAVNPLLRLDESAFRIAGQAQAWTASTPRRAGVSSFGFSGTNAHAVVEQPPETTPRRIALGVRFDLIDCRVGMRPVEPASPVRPQAPKSLPVTAVGEKPSPRTIVLEELKSVSGLNPSDIADQLLLDADLGMDSIKLMGLMARLAREGHAVPDAARLNAVTTVGDLLAALGPVDEVAATDLPVLPASYLFLLGHHLIGSSPLCSMVRLKGRLDLDRLQAAWQHLVDTNPGLRVTWHLEGAAATIDDYRARLRKEATVPAIPVVDLAHLTEPAREAELQRRFDAALDRDWDLAQWPLHLFSLCRLGPDEHALFLMDEHVIADGIGNQLVLGRLLETYAALESGLRLPVGMSDTHFVRLLEAHSTRAVPADNPEADARSYEWNPGGKSITASRPRFVSQAVETDANRTTALKRAAAALGGNLNGLFVLALARAASRTMPGPHPAVQVPTGGRAVSGIDAADVIGCFAQNLTLSASDSMLVSKWSEALPQVGHAIWDRLAKDADATDAHALANAIREVPLVAGHVPDGLKAAFRARLRSNLYAPYIGDTGIAPRCGTLAVTSYRAGTVNGAGTLDLLHEIFDGRLHASWNYDANVFGADDVARLRSAFEAELDAALAEADRHGTRERASPDDVIPGVLRAAIEAAGLAGADDLDSLQRVRVIARLPAGLRGDADLRRRLLTAPDLVAMGQVLAQEDALATLDGIERPLDLILRQCRDHPDALAVTGPDGTLTYGELDEQSARLAGLLRQRGVGAGDRVGMLMERGAAFIRGAIAIMRAGAAYVPIDAAYPRDRMAYIAGHARLSALVSDPANRAAALDVAGETPVIDATDGWRGTAPADHLPLPDPGDAMVILYTSGTTGRPKGVELDHRGYGNRLAWHQRQFALRPGEGVLQKTSVCFDISVWELFWPLMYGGTVHVLDPASVRDPWALADAMRTHQIAVMHFVPSMFGEFLNALAGDAVEPFPALRWVVLSGEALPVPAVRRWFDMFTQPLANLYGPTEASIDVTCEVIAHAPEPDALRVPIGLPIPHVDLHVVDADMTAVVDGETGELLIGGVQLAKGYFDAPELTERAFVPFDTPGGRAYRTGDLVRRLADGRIDYLGRNDSQVKLRGHRIELSEVEAVLANHPAVREAAVIVEDAGGDKRLAAFLAASGLTEAAIRTHAEAHLAAYMLPHRYEIRDTLPKNHNGKLDRGALKQDALKEGVEIVRSGPLAPAQRWLLQHFAPPHAFWGYTRFGYDGPLDRDRLITSYRHLVRRHEALRTVFRLGADGMLRQYVLDPDVAGRATLDWFDADGLAPADVDAEITRRLDAGCAAFDLERGQLDWGLVVRHGPERHEFCLANHHINGDFVSGDILFRDFWAVHDSLAKGIDLPAAPDTGGQIDLAETLVAMDTNGSLDADRTFWTKMARSKEFAFAPDDANAPNRECDAIFIEHELAEETTRALQDDVRRSLASGFYAVLAAPLYRALAEAAGSRRAIVSHRMTGRAGAPGKSVSASAGNFAVHYPLRLKVGSKGTADLVGRLQEVLDRVPNGGVSYDWLAGSLPEGSYPDEMLTPVRLNYLGALPQGRRGPFVFAPEHHNQRFGTSTLARSAQIELHAGLRGQRLWLRWTWPENRFARTRVERLAERHRDLLEDLARQYGKETT
jgi:amino acid adenylation domain-containing protein